MKKLITNHLQKLLEKGLIQNRDNVVQVLKDAGFEMARMGKDYISIKETAAQKLAQTQSQVSFLKEQHQKLFQKFNTLEAYSEDGKDYLALSKGWKIKEIREQSGKILWAIVKR